MSDDQMGSLAYSAYSIRLGGQRPPWEHLTNRERDAWFAAMEALYEVYKPDLSSYEDPECPFCTMCNQEECVECGGKLICPTCDPASTVISTSPDVHNK